MSTTNPLMRAHDGRTCVKKAGDHTSATGQPAAPRSLKQKGRRWSLWFLILVIAVVGGSWMARGPIAAYMEKVVIQHLAERGVYLHYARHSWSLGQGLRLEEVVMQRHAGDDQPPVEVSALTVGIFVPELLKTHSLVSGWSTKDATVTLRDDAGPITFNHVTARIVVLAGQIETPRLDFQQGPRTCALAGKILLAPSANAAPSPPLPLAMDLSPVRDVLAILNFKAGHVPFAIRGNYSLDVRGQEALWQADLSGSGRDIVWQGVPLRNATAQGHLSSAGLNLTSRLQFATGSADVSLTRRDWDSAPLLMSGSLTDGANQTDQFSADYEFTSLTLNVSNLRGKAHLVEFARNFPMLAFNEPAAVQFQKFPDLAVTNFSYSFVKQPGAWSVESIQTHSPGDVTIRVGGEPLEIRALQGVIAFANHTWKGHLKTGPLRWSNLSVTNADLDGTLAASRLQAMLALRLTKGSADLELSSEDWLQTPLHFRGSLTDSQGLVDRVSGSYQREPEALRIAQLDGKANLLEYATNFPDLTARPPEAFHFSTFPEIAVTDFAYHPGKSVTLGSLRLVNPADLTVPFRGRPVAIGHVEGQVGFDGRAWQISRLRGRLFGGQFSLDGSYENGTLRHADINASGLHLAQLKAWMGHSPNSIGEAVLAFNYRGGIGADLSQFTGAGSIRLENAPIVNVPLLDQTYTLASVFTSRLSRHGPGRLDATFTSASGVAQVAKFTATSDAVKVTAEGAVNLRRREVSGHARGNLRGVFGIATSPLSRTLEMQVSGPLDNIRVRPIGLKGVLNVLVALVPDTARGASHLLQNGVALPLRVFDLFEPTPPQATGP